MTVKVTTLSVKPGIQRDGTQFAADGYVDGEWVRFQRGMPRKIGGYNGIFLNATGVSRGMTMTSTGGLNYVISGYNNGLEQWSTDNDDGVGFGPQKVLPIGSITTYSITTAGKGYVNGTYTSISPVTATGNGTGATFTVVVSGNVVASITATANGTGYGYGDTFSFASSSIGGNNLSTVAVTGTAGQFSCASTITLVVGQAITVTGILSGTATGISAGTYYVITGGTTSFTLSTTLGGTAIVTTAGTTTGLTFNPVTLFSGSINSVTYSGVNIAPSANYFQPNNDNLWQFDIGYDSTGGNANNVVAHPGQNLTNIDSTTNTRPLFGAFPGSTLAPVGVFTAAGSTNSTTTFTLTTANTRVGAGQTITGTGIPSGTTVVSVVGTAVTMSAAATATGSITATFDNNISVSGGVVILHPYLFVYGNNGLIQNCAAGDFSDWKSSDANANNVSTGKIVKGLPIRGGTTSPSGLFWALDSVIRVSYAPSTVNGLNFYWRYDLLTSQTSIMSSQCVIEYDGIFYWCGVDRFLCYNGVVQEIPNTLNQNYFFDNLNYAQRQKVWVSKVPRFGEIWWFYPKGNATECTDAIIYNVREKTWYDAGQAYGARRSAGAFSEVFRNPVWAGNEVNTQGKYTIWQHEKGVNQIYLTNVNAIRSMFETCNLGLVTGGPGNPQLVGDNLWARIDRVEPDFVQEGEMNVVITGKGYANDVDIESAPYSFQPDTLKVDMREQRRELRLRFESNVENGNYQMGKILISVEGGDVRSTGNP